MPIRKSQELKEDSEPRVPGWIEWKFRTLQSRLLGARSQDGIPVPGREALVDSSEVSLNGDVQDSEHIVLGQEEVSEVVRNPLQNHNRMNSGKGYCLLTTIHKATRQGCRALSRPMWNSASIADMMNVNFDVTEAVVLDHIMAILYVGQ